MLSRPACKERDARNLKTWTENEGCLARDETEYLLYKQDLVSLGASGMDYFDSALESPVEDAVIRTRKLFKMVSLLIRTNNRI